MNKVILLVEDNASDEKLTLLAFKQCGVANEVVVARDGVGKHSLIPARRGEKRRGRTSCPPLFYSI